MSASSKTGNAYQLPQLENLNRKQVRHHLVIPSPYFVDRGFPREILNAFDVGHSREINRVIIPFYDEVGDRCIGSISHSVKPVCNHCQNCHDRWVNCEFGQSKWRVSPGFSLRSFLYNLRNAKLSDAPNILLVEGAPDVWRVAEAGHIAVAVLGSDVTAEQLALLKSPEKTILVAFRNNEAGRSGWDRVQKKLTSSQTGSRFTRFTIPAEFKDLRDVPAKQLQEYIGETMN